jgi:hypothetical protein
MELCSNSTTPYNQHIDEVFKQALTQRSDDQGEIFSKVTAASVTRDSHSSLVNSNNSGKKVNNIQKVIEYPSKKNINYHHCYLSRHSSNATTTLSTKSRGIVILARLFLFQVYRSEIGHLIQLEDIDNEEYNREQMSK